MFSQCLIHLKILANIPQQQFNFLTQFRICKLARCAAEELQGRGQGCGMSSILHDSASLEAAVCIAELATKLLAIAAVSAAFLPPDSWQWQRSAKAQRVLGNSCRPETAQQNRDPEQFLQRCKCCYYYYYVLSILRYLGTYICSCIKKERFHICKD